METTQRKARTPRDTTVQTVTTVKSPGASGGWASTVAVADPPQRGFSEINWQIRNAMVQ